MKWFLHANLSLLPPQGQQASGVEPEGNRFPTQETYYSIGVIQVAYSLPLLTCKSHPQARPYSVRFGKTTYFVYPLLKPYWQPGQKKWRKTRQPIYSKLASCSTLEVHSPWVSIFSTALGEQNTVYSFFTT